MSKRYAWLLIGLLVMAGMVQAQSVSKEQLEKDLAFLSSDALEGRRPFSLGIRKAETYIRERFRRAGLEVLPPFLEFEQSFQIRRVKQLPAESSLQLNGNPCAQALFRADRTVQFRGNVVALSERFEISDFRERDPSRLELSDLSEAARDQWIWIGAQTRQWQRKLEPLLRHPIVTDRLSQGNVAALVFSPCYVEHPETIELEIRVDSDDLTLSNTVAYLPGKNRLLSDQTLIFSAHHDHIGLSKGPSADRVFNGANDNASGTAIVLGLADYFAKQSDLQRSLAFVTFTAEEMGGLGAQKFLAELPIPEEKIVALINFEMVGKPSIWGRGQSFLTGFDYSSLGKILGSSVPGDQTFRIHPDPYPNLRLFFRSDNVHFARREIPAHTLSSTPIDTDQDYHKVSDEYGTLDLDHILAVIEGVILGTRGMISGAQTPSRIQPTDLISAGGP